MTPRQIQRILGVSDAELSGLTHKVGITDLGALVSLLERFLIAERIPEIVRTPDVWLGNRTIVEVLTVEGTSPVMDYLDRLFSHAPE